MQLVLNDVVFFFLYNIHILITVGMLKFWKYFYNYSNNDFGDYFFGINTQSNKIQLKKFMNYKSSIDMCFSDKEHYFSQKGYVMDTQKLNIKTHLENLSTILNDLLTTWYYMYIGTTFLQRWRSFQGECLFQINIGLFCLTSMKTWRFFAFDLVGQYCKLHCTCYLY